MTADHISLPIHAGFQTVRGLEYRDTNGVLITCYQLCKGGFAYAVCDFEGRLVKRFQFADSIGRIAPLWHGELIKERIRSQGEL